MFTVKFQCNFQQITATLVFQLEDVNSLWLAIWYYSGVPGLSTGSLI